MTEQSWSGRGRTQYSHLQVASKEIALCAPPGFCASEFTLTTMPHGDSIQLLPSQTQIIASLLKKKIIMTFHSFPSVDLQIETRGKSRRWSSVLFCNSHFHVVIFYWCCNTWKVQLPLSVSSMWRAWVVITTEITNSKWLSTLLALPPARQRATQHRGGGWPIQLEALTLGKITAWYEQSTELITPSTLNNLTPW